MQTAQQKHAERDRLMYLLEMELHGALDAHERAELAVLRHRYNRQTQTQG